MREDILQKKEEILQWISENQPKSFICKQLHCKPETLNSYLKKMDIEYAGNMGLKGFQNKNNDYMSAVEYASKSQGVKSYVLKNKLIRDGLREEKCELCKNTEWQGMKIPLELHHKDGNHYNNNFDNLLILCPNCHAIQPGNSGANKNKYVAVLELEDNTRLECVPERGVGSNPTSNTKYCIDCGKEISKNATRCKSCAAHEAQNSRSPSRENLKNLIRTKPFLQIGKEYGVSDNAVRKWCKFYNLPYKVSEIKLISDEDWINI